MCPLNCSARAARVRASLAATRSPVVHLSKRCTMPGRITPGSLSLGSQVGCGSRSPSPSAAKQFLSLGLI